MSKWEKLGDFFGQKGQPLGAKEKKLLTNLLVVGLVGLILMLLSGLATKPQQKEEPPKPVPKSSEPDLKRELEELLSQIRGAGEVKVALTFEGGVRREYAVNSKEMVKDSQDDGDRKTTESTLERQQVLLKKEGMREEALLTQQLAPKILGVLVVATGAGDDLVAERLSRATATFLGIGQNRIAVMEGK